MCHSLRIQHQGTWDALQKPCIYPWQWSGNNLREKGKHLYIQYRKCSGPWNIGSASHRTEWDELAPSASCLILRDKLGWKSKGKSRLSEGSLIPMGSAYEKFEEGQNGSTEGDWPCSVIMYLYQSAQPDWIDII
jgi:hypothetical protein